MKLIFLFLILTFGNFGALAQEQSPDLKTNLALAEQGNAEAQFFLGHMYYKGLGVPKDLVKAIYWFTKAAEQGNLSAQQNLGGIYFYDKEVPHDFDAGFYWYTKAAEQDNAFAQRILGEIYLKGVGVPCFGSAKWQTCWVVPKDLAKALDWLTKAAEKGNAEAQNALGEMYLEGLGLQKNRILAYAWFDIAASIGQLDDAAKNRTKIRKKMTEEQIVEAQRLSFQWKPGQSLQVSQ